MSLRTDQVNLILHINGQQAGSTIKDLEAKSRALKQQLARIPVDDADFKKVAGELKNVNSALAQAREQTKGVGVEMDKLRTQSSGLSKVAGIVGGIFAAIGGVGAIINARRETEKLFAVLKNATGGSESGAQKVFKQLQEFAATTPFALNEVVGAFTKLQQRNFNPTIEQLRTMGDIAASSGKSIDQFVEAILDAQTGEFERLKEFGVVAHKEGDQITATFRGQATTFKNTTENMNQYLLGLGKMPGIAGATAAVSKTLDGSLSNLGDNFTRLLSVIGGSGGVLKGFVDLLNKGLDAINGWLEVPLSEELKQQQTDFNALIGVLKDVNASEETRNRAIQELQTNYPDYIGNIDLHKASENDLNKIVDAGNNLFAQRIFIQSKQERLLDIEKRRNELQQQLLEGEKKLQTAQQRTNEGRGGFLGLGLNKQEEIDKFNNVVSARAKALEFLAQEQEDFLKEQQEFAKRFNLEFEEKTPDPKKPTGGPAGKSKQEAEAAAGSIAFLRKQIADFQKELEKTPADSKALKPLLEQMKAAEEQLKAIEDRIARLKNPAQDVAPTLDQLDSQTNIFGEGGSAGPSGFDFQNQAELDSIIQFNDAKMGLEEQFLTDVAALRDRNAQADQTRREQEISFETQMQELRVSTTQRGINTVIDLLGSDEKARKKHGAIIKALEIANVGVNLAAEISSIRRWAAAQALNAVIPGWAQIYSGVQIGIAIAQALAQTAKIAKAKFAGGGYTGPGSGSADNTGHRPVGIVHANEWVSPPWMTQHPVYGRYVAALESVRSRGFADGGFTTTPSVNVLQGPAGSSTDGVLMAMVATVSELKEAVRRFPREVRASVAYTEIEDVGKTLGDVRDEAAL